jgi:hypothetical protein
MIAAVLIFCFRIAGVQLILAVTRELKTLLAERMKKKKKSNLAPFWLNLTLTVERIDRGESRYAVAPNHAC